MFYREEKPSVVIPHFIFTFSESKVEPEIFAQTIKSGNFGGILPIIYPENISGENKWRRESKESIKIRKSLNRESSNRNRNKTKPFENRFSTETDKNLFLRENRSGRGYAQI